MLLVRVRRYALAHAAADLAARGVQNLRTFLIRGRRVGPVHVGAEILCPQIL